MAQWGRSDHTLFTKIVYCGPALGGKTTNLRSLHAITDPEGRQQVVSLDTADDRTLFFDLLPFELGQIFGYTVAIKVYTVPGQVRYDATRRVVLAGADAVVFVADSARQREPENRSSFENLRMNLRANRIDPNSIPIVFQFNKQDLVERASPAEMASWFGIDEAQAVPAVAPRGFGVLDTFAAASKAMLDRLVTLADPQTRRDLDPGNLSKQVDRAFAAFRGRTPAAAATSPRGAGQDRLVLKGDDLLDDALQASLKLGGDLAAERSVTARLTREAEALRSLSESILALGATFDREAIVRSAVASARSVLDAVAATLVRVESDGSARTEAAIGREIDPLLSDEAGAGLLSRIRLSSAACCIDDLQGECGEAPSGTRGGLGSLIAAPVGSDGRMLLLAYSTPTAQAFGAMDVRFLATLAAHLAVGLDQARIHAELARNRDELESIVRSRTRALRRAIEELREVDATKDRFLSGLSHEMRTPLTVIASSAAFLRDYDGGAEERKEMVEGIVVSAGELGRLLDRLFRVARMDDSPSTLARAATPAADLVAEALRLTDSPLVRVSLNPGTLPLQADAERLARALANIVDNAVKFSPPGSPVEIEIGPCTIGRGEAARPAVSLSVLDRGPGVPEADRERIFAAFEQGGDPLTSKPRGVGLGLFEARVIVRRHGGLLRHVARPGGGSEFHLVIPASAGTVESEVTVG